MSKTKPYKPNVKSGDLVEVITGDHKGARGNVLRILKKNPPNGVRVLIESVNMVKKTVRPSSRSAFKWRFNSMRARGSRPLVGSSRM